MSREVLVDGTAALVGHTDGPDVPADGDGGLYYRDTRHLSALTATVGGASLATVGRELTASNRRRVVAAAVDSAVNRVDTLEHKRTDLVVHVDQRVGEDDGLCQRVTVANRSPEPRSRTLVVGVDADFADVFEVRGYASRLDRDVTASVGDRTVEYAHEYAAGGATERRTSTVAFDPEPTALSAGRAAFDLDLGAQSTATVEVRVTPEFDGGDEGGNGPTERPYAVDVGTVETGDRSYDRVFERAAADLAALTTDSPEGPVALAGVPWFATVFGRDALLTAYQALPVAPALARGTLRHLAAHRGTTEDAETEEAPGKVFHEVREGELARRERIPHTPYYGTVDATPLWVVVLAETWRFTGDDALVADLEGALSEALGWIDRKRAAHGDDPFLYYEGSPETGLEHKAWRDTPGSVQHPDGTEAEHPIASVEVQGYVYRALRDAATLSEAVLGEPERAESLRERADRLAEAFESAFWLPEAGYYGVAKDGRGEVVATRTSNVGHCLLAGIVPESRAAAVAETLGSPPLFTGWGVRTVASTADGYSPLSYHLGSVWPHDTALSALGLARYGRYEDAERLATGIVDAARHFENARLPELFCGFDDRLEPKPYPASCVPQAWSAAAPVALLRAAFALEPTDGGVSVGRSPAAFDDRAIEPITDYWNHER